MAKLKIYEYPHPVLKQKSVKVDAVDAEVRKLLDNMLETMYAAAGVGLAAPQVGVLKRIVVIDITHEDEGEKRAPLFLVNPEIIWHSDEEKCQLEGCLSLPDQSAEVSRFKQVRVRYRGYDGKENEILAEGLLAVALQHEIDHLDGILYIDHISRLKRQMLVKKLQKMRQEEAGEED